MINQKTIRIFTLLLITTILSGCSTYHWGSLMHPQIKTIAIAPTINLTKKAGRDIKFRNALAQRLMSEGSLTLKNRKNADAILKTKIVSLVSKALASSKTRDETNREEDRDAYQTSIYQVEVIVEYEVTITGETTTVLPKKQIKGVANFSKTPDMIITSEAATRKALNDAAEKIIIDIVEGW